MCSLALGKRRKRELDEEESETTLQERGKRIKSRPEDLDKILGYLKPIKDEWPEIGRQLGLSKQQLDDIATRGQETEEKALERVLEQSIDFKSETTWEALCKVLENVEGGIEIAETIRQEKDKDSTHHRSTFLSTILPTSHRSPFPYHYWGQGSSHFELDQPRTHAADFPELGASLRFPLGTSLRYPADAKLSPNPFPTKCKDRITLEGETKEIRKKFSTLLSTVLDSFRYTNTQELTTKLSCYDNRYSTLTKQCRNMEDVIQILAKNVSFLDYDLLQFVLEYYESQSQSYFHSFQYACNRVESYSLALQQYLRNRLYEHSDKLMLPVDCQMSIDTRLKNRLKFIAESITKKEIELEELSVDMLFTDFNKESELDEEKAAYTDLRGVELLEETKVTVTNSPQLFEWKGYGLRLLIPRESLPEAVESCTITIKASLAGQYQFPHNTELVSPVFWLRCEPQRRFNARLSLSIQHCALPRNSFRLFIARAQCTQTDLPYSFKVLHGGTFSEHDSYGVISLNQFSGVAVVQERSDERRYWSSVYYMGPPNNRDIHFTVTWHDDAHITTVKKEYSQRKATVGPQQSITFKDPAVALKIPRDGLILQEKWKVFPATPPKIVKKEVDDHQPQHTSSVPHCELVAKWITQDKRIQPLEHTVDILGTEEEEKYFTINIDPGQKAQESEAIETENTSKSPLQMQHLHAIKECLKDLSQDKIIEVGLALGLLYPNLRKMTMLPEDMIQAWLEKRDKVLSFSGEPTMQSLITALESSGLAGTVDIVRSKFITD